MPVNYKNGIIYRIYDNTNGDVYYGSTANVLRYRMGKHKSEAKEYKSKCKSKSIILNDDYIYSEVEKYPCNSKEELRTRERYYIENFTCVNKYCPIRTAKERVDMMSEKNQKYRDDTQHQEERRKLEEIKMVCECGASIRKYGLSQHLLTKKHINLMNGERQHLLPKTPIICIECK